MKTAQFTALALILVIVMVLTTVIACNPGTAPAPAPSPTPSAKPSPSPTPTAKPSPKPTATPAAPAIKTGGTFSYAITSIASSFDLHMKPSYGNYWGSPIFETLVTFDRKMPVGGNVYEYIAPKLAEKWEVSKDNLVYTFYLRKNVKWHDGKPFTAADVVYSFNKMVDPKRSSLASMFTAFDRAEKVDDYTVKVYLKSPSPGFLVNLANASSSMQAAHKAGLDGRTYEFLMGTGPYKVGPYTQGVSYDFVKNPDYWGRDSAGRQLPYLDTVRLFIIADNSRRAAALATKQIDMLDPNTGIGNAEYLAQVKSQVPDAVIAYSQVDYATYFWLNQTYAPLKDLRVRQALTLVTDPVALRIAKSGSADFGGGKDPIFYDGWGLPTADVNKLLGWDKPMDQRIAQAQKLMADAGYADGFALKVSTYNIREYENTVTLWLDTLAKTLKIKGSMDSRIVAEIVKSRDAGDFQALYTTPLANVDPDEFAAFFATGGASNWLKYSNPQVDALFKQQSTETDPAKRKALVQQIEKLLIADMPFAPTDKWKNATAWQSYVKGFEARANGPTWQNWDVVWLDK